jgi:hypothetical protein
MSTCVVFVCPRCWRDHHLLRCQGRTMCFHRFKSLRTGEAFSWTPKWFPSLSYTMIPSILVHIV